MLRNSFIKLSESRDGGKAEQCSARQADATSGKFIFRAIRHVIPLNGQSKIGACPMLGLFPLQ
jgi:hypothetical protein